MKSYLKLEGDKLAELEEWMECLPGFFIWNIYKQITDMSRLAD